jgi:hypothetical protein
MRRKSTDALLAQMARFRTIAPNVDIETTGIVSSGSGGEVNVLNSIIAKNTASTDPDFSGALTSQRYYLIGNNSGATVTPANQTGDQIGTTSSSLLETYLPVLP